MYMYDIPTVDKHKVIYLLVLLVRFLFITETRTVVIVMV